MSPTPATHGARLVAGGHSGHQTPLLWVRTWVVLLEKRTTDVRSDGAVAKYAGAHCGEHVGGCAVVHCGETNARIVDIRSSSAVHNRSSDL